MKWHPEDLYTSLCQAVKKGIETLIIEKKHSYNFQANGVK
jgi:hypothetical protein